MLINAAPGMILLQIRSRQLGVLAGTLGCLDCSFLVSHSAETFSTGC